MSAWPVVVVTGANAGVGYGICRRLLFQLCLSNPPDSWPQPWAHTSDANGSEPPPRSDGLTLIMACRSTQRAEAARKELYNELDAHIAGLRAHPGYDGHAEVFRDNLKIEVEYLDLATLSTVFSFAAHMSKQYTYISHLIFNAGVANFTGIDWNVCLRQLARNFLNTITKPEFNLQSVGEVSVDGFGWVWQSNLFGHYALFRALEPLLNSTSYTSDARVIWSTSLESTPKFFDKADWQLTKTAHAYESAKYQIDLIAPLLDRRALQDPAPSKRVRHFISHPGICHTKISTKLVQYGGVLDTLKLLAFYLGRILLGSRHHPITPANGAVAAVHLVLVSISYITFSAFLPAKSDADATLSEPKPAPVPLRFGAETDRWGNPANEVEGKVLLGRCEDIYRGLLEKRGTPLSES
ncbi:3-keto sterol reductase [Mycena latifolia]|nr:3-keto sterol reductase [Mycena latifolia]